VFTLLDALLALAVLVQLRLPEPLVIFALIAGSVLAVASMLYTGLLLAQMVSVDVWHTWLLPVLFTISSLTCGLAAVMLIEAICATPLNYEATGQRSGALLSRRAFLTRWHALLTLGCFDLAVLAAFIIERTFSTAIAQSSIAALITGAQAPAFWGFVVAGGLALPLCGHILYHFVPQQSVVITSAIGVLVGGYFLRSTIVGISQFTALFP
jgi:formate-dependent nitrite reductase membrane component NrfD